MGTTEEEVQRSLGILEGKLDLIMVTLGRISHDIKDLKTDHVYISARVRKLEDAKNRVVGAAAVVSLAVATFWELVSD
jgi:hypothetical protein